MKLTASIILCIALLVDLQFMAPAEETFTKDEIKVFLARHTPMVDSALDAYNKGNFKAFYRDFSSERLERTEEIFKKIWMGDYKGQYGNLISKELLEGRCKFNAAYPLLKYKAKFAKHDDVTIKVIFSKENGEYKIFYIRFDVLLPGEE